MGGAGGRRRGGRPAARREEGLKKKASELAKLCGVDVCLVGVDPAGNFFFWPDDLSELWRVAGRYLDAVGGGGGDGAQFRAARGKKRRRPVAAAPEEEGAFSPAVGFRFAAVSSCGVDLGETDPGSGGGLTTVSGAMGDPPPCPWGCFPPPSCCGRNLVDPDTRGRGAGEEMASGDGVDAHYHCGRRWASTTEQIEETIARQPCFGLRLF